MKKDSSAVGSLNILLTLYEAMFAITVKYKDKVKKSELRLTQFQEFATIENIK